MRRAQYFEDLLNSDSVTDANMNMHEYMKAADIGLAFGTKNFTSQQKIFIAAMKKGKSAGCDTLVTEAVQYGGQLFPKDSGTSAIESLMVIVQWRRSEIVPMPKKSILTR